MPIPIWLAITIGATGIALARVDYNMFFMRFFRDLSRSKARARLHNNKYAMIPVMLGIEEPIKIQDDINAENTMTITREQLEEMDGFDGAPLYLAIKGRVYDVSAGDKFYAEGKEYHEWVGKDASRSFGTGCRGGIDRTGMDCLSSSVEGLTEKVRFACDVRKHDHDCKYQRSISFCGKKELKEIDRWLELYEVSVDSDKHDVL